MSASGNLRERVLAGVHGQPAITTPSGTSSLGARLLAPAVALLVGAALGAALVSTLSSSDGSSARLAEPHASLRRVGSRAELTVSDMAEPPIGQVYEVWILGPGANPRPTDALFTVTSKGSGTVDVPGGLGHGVRDVLVTSEPLGGSTTPTGPVVLRVPEPRPL
ncbi:MAG: anti-sigma factor domain-containing protein [Solirubrobacteraceae bacterium]